MSLNVLSRWYLLTRWTFYYHTWCGDASLWARLSVKKIGLLSSRWRSQLRIIKMCLLNIWTTDPFAMKLGLMAHHHKADCLVKRLGCSVVVRVQGTGKVQNSSECTSGWYLLSCRPVTRLGMVIQHHGPKCHARRLVCCLQVQGHSEGLVNPYLTAYAFVSRDA